MNFRTLCVSALALFVAAAPVSVQAESLREALTAAYNNNPNISSALLAVKSTAEGIVSAKAGKLPTVGMGLDLTHSFDNRTGSFAQTDTASLGLSYNQTLFDNGRTDAAVEQARALTEVSAQALRNAEQNVLLSVVQAYMGVIRDSQLVQLRSDNVKFLQAQVKSSQDRLDIGEGTKLDVSQAQTSLATGVASYQAAIANLQSSQASYERWVGHKPRNLTQDFSFKGMLPKSVEEATSLSEVYHPAILSAKAAIRAAQSGSDQARAAFGPTLGLIGKIGTAETFSNSNGTNTISGSLGLSLTIPLYSGGALGASVRKANLGQMKSEFDSQVTRDQVREAVVTSWATLQNAVAQIDSAQQALNAASLALDATVQSRDVGQSTTLDVLNAQSQVTQAREALISATSSRVIASFALVSATGKLSAQDLKLPVKIKSADGYIATVEDVWQDLRAIAE
ncbi:transporter [Youhaiella tibetensis]|uniref:TolC family outer membrane protein n=1 Tax=Paradevosia tibetensis TaxID=1447062 RepID=A0A5B9DN36_9HYPH|nr:TolC family outer membrane protein [Youhaiella tibetensis]QEE20760.1 TolC family outer membrane protein [Youhaiella tibetensis]GGF21211.1 transporter [Youhaiella tibetensis]